MLQTTTLQKTVNWVAPYLGFRPLNLGTGSEPAVTNANIVQQTILGAPFAWRWNRSTLTFVTVKGTQDYEEAVDDFGYPEKANVATTTDTKEITIQNCLAMDSKQGRPMYVAAQFENPGSPSPFVQPSITFRLTPVPDGEYTVTITYQKAAPLFADLSDLWSLPDTFAYVYQRGFLALALMYADDPKFQIENAKFVAHLLGASEGLDETQRNIFLNQWQTLTGHEAGTTIKIQQGSSGRGV